MLIGSTESATAHERGSTQADPHVAHGMFRLRTVVMSAKRLHHAGLPFDGHLAHPFRTRTARMLQFAKARMKWSRLNSRCPKNVPLPASSLGPCDVTTRVDVNRGMSKC
jgi:hypothetical protein